MKLQKKNDPDATVDLLPLSDNFSGFTQRYSSQEERVRMGQLVNDGRDTFLKSRNWDFGLVILCSGIKLSKRGSTELIDLTEGWKSMDTLSAHVSSIKKFKCKRKEISIGYGTAFSDDDLDDDDYDYAGSRTRNPNASSDADSSEGIANGYDPAPYTIGGGAIPSFHELSESALEQEDPRTHLTIRVTKPKGAQRYTGGSSIIKPKGRLDLYQGQHASGQSASIARVEVYFERPDGANPLFGKAELGSLFNPYWQVRLVSVSASDRALAQTMQGRMLP